MDSGYVKLRTNKEKLWEHGNTGQFWKETLGGPHFLSTHLEFLKV